MMKSLGAIAFLTSMLVISGCIASPEPADDEAAVEDIGSAQQEVTNGAVNAACAESLTLRSSPGGGVIGTMYTGPDSGISGFYVQSTSGSWSYGYSYGLGKWGYAMASYLTTNYSQSGTPGQIGYRYQCCRADGSCMGGGVS